MVSAAQAPALEFAPFFSLGAILQSLFAQTSLVKALQRARALQTFKHLAQRAVTGELTAREVEEARHSPSGKAMSVHPLGLAGLALLHAAGLYYDENLEPISMVLRPAKEQALTRGMATIIEGAILERLGRYPSVTDTLNTVPAEELNQSYWKTWYIGLLGEDVTLGVKAATRWDSVVFEGAVARFVEMKKEAEGRGLRGLAEATLAAYEKFLQQDFAGALQETGMLPPKRLRRDVLQGGQRAYEKIHEATRGEATKGFQEFALAVRLEAIEDPWEAWDALAGEVSKRWPPGLSAVEAIREMRDENA